MCTGVWQGLVLAAMRVMKGIVAYLPWILPAGARVNESMHEGRPSSWLQRTHQRWKLAAFGLTVGLAFALCAGSDLISTKPHTYPLWPNLAG